MGIHQFSDPLTTNTSGRFIWVVREFLKFKEHIYKNRRWYWPKDWFGERKIIHSVFTIPKELMSKYDINNPKNCSMIIVYLDNRTKERHFHPMNFYNQDGLFSCAEQPNIIIDLRDIYG